MEITFSGVFREIDPPGRLQRTERFEQMPGPDSIVTLTSMKAMARRRSHCIWLFQSKEACDGCLRSGMELGVKECFQKIDELIAAM
jgi:hypothetical protein